MNIGEDKDSQMWINQHGKAARKVLNMSKQTPKLNMSLLYYKKLKEQALSLLTCKM